MAGRGYSEAITWSFCDRATATAFGGGTEALVLANPIAAELDCMRPSALVHLLRAGQRNANLGQEGARLFEAGPIYLGDGPNDQRTVIAAMRRPSPARHWQGAQGDDVFALKADLLALLEALGHPADKFQTGAADGAYWHPGRSATLRLGPKAIIARFGELHPRTLKALDVEGAVTGFELILDALPVAKAKASKARPALALASLSPINRDFAFLVDAGVPAEKLTRAALGADKALITAARVFDVYRGQGVPEGKVSLALEVRLEPREKALTDAEIDTVCAQIVGAVSKATGASLRG
jgi:phenylalanyl-tRNA synthetase beta chain